MGPIQHLSDLCQQQDVQPVIDYLRRRVRARGAEEVAAGTAGSVEEPVEVGSFQDLMLFHDADGRTALHWAIALRNYDLAETLLKAPYCAPGLSWDHSGGTTFLTAVMVGASGDFVRALLERCIDEYPAVMQWLEAEEREAGGGGGAAATHLDPTAPASGSPPPASASPGAALDDNTEESGGRIAASCPLPRHLKLNFSTLSDKEEEEARRRRKCIAAAVVNAPDAMGNSALLTAVSRGHTGLVDLLLDLGADTSVQNAMGQTVLHRAVSKSNYALVEKLVRLSEKMNGGASSKAHRAFMNIADKRGDTALFYASMENDEEIGSFLLQHGANREHKNKQGKYFYEL